MTVTLIMDSKGEQIMDDIPKDTFVFGLRLLVSSVFLFNMYLFVSCFCPTCGTFYVCVGVGASKDGRDRWENGN